VRVEASVFSDDRLPSDDTVNNKGYGGTAGGERRIRRENGDLLSGEKTARAIEEIICVGALAFCSDAAADRPCAPSPDKYSKNSPNMQRHL
jgi:hypothetical protein